MKYITKVNRGNMFKNEQEGASAYIGEVNIEGTLYFVDAYINEGSKGKYFSLKFKKKNKQDGAEQPILEEDVLM